MTVQVHTFSGKTKQSQVTRININKIAQRSLLYAPLVSPLPKVITIPLSKSLIRIFVCFQTTHKYGHAG